MAKASNIVHQYFKKEIEGLTILVKVNPISFKVTEITLENGEDPEVRELEADDEIFDDLKSDGFAEASPMEFNLYWSGLIG
jgi:hypothetical protein